MNINSFWRNKFTEERVKVVKLEVLREQVLMIGFIKDGVLPIHWKTFKEFTGSYREVKESENYTII